MRPLSDAERKLAEDNLNLVYFVAYKMANAGQLPKNVLDDAISEGMYGLMRAAVLYDPSRGLQFSTLGVMCIRNQIMSWIRKETTQRKMVAISIDMVVSEGSGKSAGKTWAETLPAVDDTEQDAVLWLNEYAIQKMEEQGKGHWVQLLMENANGATMEELAAESGVTKQRICKQIHQARNMLQGILYREDWRA